MAIVRFSEKANDYFIDGERLGRDNSPKASNSYQGACSAVYPGGCTLDRNKERVALKMIFNYEAPHDTTTTLVNKYHRDFSILERLPKHPHLLRVYSKFAGQIDTIPSRVGPIRDLDLIEDIRQKRALFIVCELGTCTLKQFLLTERHKLTALEVCKIAEALLSAVAFLEQHGVAHCDIKLDNVMLTTDGRWVLIDFGEAKDWSAPGLRDDKPFCAKFSPGFAKGGATGYMAPEIYHAQEGQWLNYTKADVFSVGCVLCDIVLGDTPFAQDIHRKASAYDSAQMLTSLPDKFTLFRPLLERLLHYDPVGRLSADLAMAMVHIIKQALVVQMEADAALHQMTAEMADMQTLVTRVTQQREQTADALRIRDGELQQARTERLEFASKVTELKQAMQVVTQREKLETCDSCHRLMGIRTPTFCHNCGTRFISKKEQMVQALDHLYGRAGYE
eukprot:TRINITY_DN2213_c0_g1_i1.p1 TRINITY_DN2213_c0_g1~~TRINITY_DN2213_c0_g1_i1.p1  ORF type:complete len:465 (-),score=92.07 TRINITY_DN2213_c0_g1_i1:38-1381(-)